CAGQTAGCLDASPPEVRAWQRQLIIALYATIRRYLRNERTWPELDDLLGPERMATVAATRCPPILVARWLSDGFVAEARAGRLSEQRLQVLDGAISDMLDLFGGCERIVRTPVPFAYAHHIQGFLTLFCVT